MGRSPETGWQSPDVDETFSGTVIELIFTAVGGHFRYVKTAAGGGTARNGGSALMQAQAHHTVHVLLSAIHESIKGILERTKLETLIHKIGPLHFELTLAAEDIGSKGEALEFLVGLNQQ